MERYRDIVQYVQYILLVLIIIMLWQLSRRDHGGELAVLHTQATERANSATKELEELLRRHSVLEKNIARLMRTTDSLIQQLTFRTDRTVKESVTTGSDLMTMVESRLANDAPDIVQAVADHLAADRAMIRSFEDLIEAKDYKIELLTSENTMLEELASAFASALAAREAECKLCAARVKDMESANSRTKRFFNNLAFLVVGIASGIIIASR